MGFRKDGFAKVWAVENKGNYSIVELSTSKKNKTSGEYETDFSNKFVRFIGTAHTDAAELTRGDSVKLGDCDVTNIYNKDKKETYTNFLVFTFEKQIKDQNNTNKEHPTPTSNQGSMKVPENLEEDELPFS